VIMTKTKMMISRAQHEMTVTKTVITQDEIHQMKPRSRFQLTTCVGLPCEAGCWRPAVDEDRLCPCSDRSTGSCSSPASFCRSRDTHLSVAPANDDHPPSGRPTTSPELQKTTGCSENDAMNPMSHGATTAAGTAACASGCISVLENSTLSACILLSRAYVPILHSNRLDSSRCLHIGSRLACSEIPECMLHIKIPVSQNSSMTDRVNK